MSHHQPTKEELIKIGMTLEEAKVFGRVHAGFLKTLAPENGSYMDWDNVTQPSENEIVHYSTLPEVDPATISSMLSKVVVVKLNGGLGTRMGCLGPKSIIEVRNDLTFLDLMVRQIEHLNLTYNVDIPLALMNSFYTDKATKKIIKKYQNKKVTIVTFEQSRFPRIYKDTLRPIPKPIGKKNKEEDGKHWFPPGSGDVFRSLRRSGLLAKFAEQGKEHIFISNVENLGSTLDVRILSDILNRKTDFAMEVTERTALDTFGGLLVKDKDKLRVLNLSMAPQSKVDFFNSPEFHLWNTNNLWVSINALQKLLDEDKLHLNFVVNLREVDGINVIQLETPAGTAIASFPNARVIEVPRRRMRTLKSTSDLFPLQSNLFDLREDGQVIMNPLRAFPSVPVIKFGEHFTDIFEYAKRFQEIPDILELDRLTVSGDVTFGTNISLKGTVVIVANPGERIDIPSGCVLENKIIAGSLRILDH